MKGEVKVIYDNFQPKTFWALIDDLREVVDRYEGFTVTWGKKPVMQNA